MPGLARRNEELNNASSVSANGFWSKHRHDVSITQLQKFWSELSPEARCKLLRIDKQTLFEQARKNMYCSRCNGLLLEGFLQIVMHGKSLQHDGGGTQDAEASKDLYNGGMHLISVCQDEIQDPSVHPWGGLSTTREGSLTLLNCYLYAKSLKTLQNVFDSARARERERELLFPDACGGEGRGWISQGMASYGRGHGTRETCALHTARLSCDTLVDFWSALGEETRQSLLRMKEEDFIERLMCRFDNKRFCRDCRRNVIREFKELKELKRMRREPRCTKWFCVADTAFQYEVSHDTIQVDWRQSFADTVGIYDHFEWGVGTEEGKSDILEFENVGMSGSVQANDLNLGGLDACFIMLRAWKLDGRCTELSVKAHALKGKQCLHCRLVVGDGYVTITRGESIKRFFEHAEEAEEEEDDDSMDKDGNETDDECSRPQKHAKSPELAREFLLDAATVIFKEQVEKAFREGTARQNAHSIFVCLAIKLLEERIHVACKEIITLEKQMKLLEEEEKEKREEEERKERRRTREREKKLRRKERLKGKEKDRENKCSVSDDISALQGDFRIDSSPFVDKETNNDTSCLDSVNETGDISLSKPQSPYVPDNQFSDGYASLMQNGSHESHDGEFTDKRDGTGTFTVEQSKISRRRSKFWKEALPNSSFKRPGTRRFTIISGSGAVVSKSDESRRLRDNLESSSRGTNGLHRQSRVNGPKSGDRNCGIKFTEKLHCPHNKMNDRYDSHSCRCHQNDENGTKAEPHLTVIRNEEETKSAGKSASETDVAKRFYHGNNWKQIDDASEGFGRTKNKCNNMSISSVIDAVPSNKVSEQMESQKGYSWNNLNADVTLRPSYSETEGMEIQSSLFKSSGNTYSGSIDCGEETMKEARNCNLVTDEDCRVDVKDSCYSTAAAFEEVGCYPAKNPSSSGMGQHSIGSTSISDSKTVSSNHGNMKSSSASDSEDSSQHSEGRETSPGIGNGFSNYQEAVLVNNLGTNGVESFGSNKSSAHVSEGPRGSSLGNLSTKSAPYHENGIPAVGMSAQYHDIFPPILSQNMHFSVFQAPATMGYYPKPVSWSTPPGEGLMNAIPHPSHYVYTGSLGYGLNGNSRMSMQYSALPHLPMPLFNPGQFPFYQPVAKANGLHSEEIIRTSAVKERLAGARIVPTKQHLTETPHGYGGKVDNVPSKLPTGDKGFSLFHFGGPAALSSGCRSDLVSSKDGLVGDFRSKISVGQAEDNPACSKRETSMEEYNLFAASNGIRFSFF